MPRGVWTNRKTLSEKLVAGTVFGRLTCTGKSELREEINSSRHKKKIVPWFECSCSCGLEKRFYSGYVLQAGRVKSCGCMMGDALRSKFKERKEREGGIPPDGTVFGNLTVVYGAIYYRLGKASIYCRCVCGRNVWKHLFYLTRGNYTSCGHVGCNTRNRTFNELRVGFLYNDYKLKAQDRDYAFDIDVEQFKVLIDGECHYCGAPQSNRHRYNRKHLGSLTFHYNGIDRMDPSRGYHAYNCVSCCKVCNMAKRTMGYEEFLSLCSRIMQRHPRYAPPYLTKRGISYESVQ